MSDADRTKSITISFKLKKDKKQPKQILLEELQEHYGMQNIICYHETAKKALAITATKDCDSYDQMKAELWPVLEATQVFKTWEVSSIRIVHGDNHCSYPVGDPYPSR